MIDDGKSHVTGFEISRAKDYTHHNCGSQPPWTPVVALTTGQILAQYRYLEKKYGKSGRAQPFWTMVVLIVLVLSSIVVAQFQ